MANVRLSREEQLHLISNLGTLLAAGVSLSGAIETLQEEAHGSLLVLLRSIQNDLTAGQTLSTGLGAFPQVFDPVVLNLLVAAEEAGTLEQTLKDLEQTLRREIEFHDRVQSALVYPLLVSIVFILVLVMILFVVMPKIAQVFGRMHIPLPLATRVLIAASGVLVANWPYMLAGGLLLALLFGFLYRDKSRLINQHLRGLPGVNIVAQQLDVARFSRVLHLLLGAGVPITHSLALAQGVIGDRRVWQQVQRARDQASAGATFSSGLKGKHSPFPPMLVKLMAVGEQTGTLEKAMLDVAKEMERRVVKTLTRLTLLLEPIMLVLVGLAVGGLMLAIIGPIYGMIGQVAGR